MSQQQEATTIKKQEATSMFTYLQYGTTAATVLLFMRASNMFISNKQRGATLIGAAGCLYLSVANEFGIFPFNFFVKEKVRIEK